MIHTFRADVEIADPGSTITLAWSWSGGDGATIYHLMSTGQLSTPWWEVGPQGSVEYTISPERRNSDSFVLFVYDQEEGVLAQETVRIELRCPDEWFFTPAPDVCPAGPPVVTEGAEQRFERGVMLWNRAEERIYVLFADGRSPAWTAYADQWAEGDMEHDPDITPPAGRVQPIRGFGLVWRVQPGVRERLGWGLAPEQGYETAIQRSSHVRYPDTYLRARDGGTWKLGPNSGSWDYIP